MNMAILVEKKKKERYLEACKLVKTFNINKEKKLDGGNIE